MGQDLIVGPCAPNPGESLPYKARNCLIGGKVHQMPMDAEVRDMREVTGCQNFNPPEPLGRLKGGDQLILPVGISSSISSD